MTISGFNINDYTELCKIISNSTYKTYSIKQFFEQHPKNDFIIIRHDVDYNINTALKIAKIESRYNVNSTYYLRLNKRTTDERITSLKMISSEIGLHYDSYAKNEGNAKKAILIFKTQLNYLNTLCNIEQFRLMEVRLRDIKMKEYYN